MRAVSILRCTAVVMAFCASAANAYGTFIPAPGRVDMVYDSKRDVVYISSGSNVLRYHVADNRFLTPIAIGGSSRGIDLSPDSGTLAVADADSGTDQLWVHVINLDTMVDRKVQAPKDWRTNNMEAGTWSVAFAYDGSLFVTSSFSGSGQVVLRRFHFGHGRSAPVTIEVVATSISQNTMLSASGDRRVIAFAEANGSDGAWGVYNVASKTMLRSTRDNGTQSFNYEIATNPDGTQYAIPTYKGSEVYDSRQQKIGTVGAYYTDPAGQPLGVAYAPADRLAYFPWQGTNEVRVYDMDALTQVGAYRFCTKDRGIVSCVNFQKDYSTPFVWVRTRISNDGSLLMFTVNGGVEILRMHSP